MINLNLAKVDFKSHELEVVEEKQSIVVKDICNSIGLRFASQLIKIKSDDSYDSKLLKVQTNGGIQEVFTIPLSKLNGWLFSINPNKVKPEVREKLIEYKNECFDVLNNYFNKGVAINPRAMSTLQGHLTRKTNRIALLEKELKELKSMLSNKLLIAQNNDCTLKPHKFGRELIKDFVGSVQKQEEAMDMMINEMIRVQKFTTQMKNRFLNNFPEADPHDSYDRALLTKVPYDI
jgi:hypothetical protein